MERNISPKSIQEVAMRVFNPMEEVETLRLEVEVETRPPSWSEENTPPVKESWMRCCCCWMCKEGKNKP